MSGRRQWADDSSVTVKLCRGRLRLRSLRGNAFTLTEGERQLIGALTTAIQKYEEAKQEPAAE